VTLRLLIALLFSASPALACSGSDTYATLACSFNPDYYWRLDVFSSNHNANNGSVGGSSFMNMDDGVGPPCGTGVSGIAGSGGNLAVSCNGTIHQLGQQNNVTTSFMSNNNYTVIAWFSTSDTSSTMAAIGQGATGNVNYSYTMGTTTGKAFVNMYQCGGGLYGQVVGGTAYTASTYQMESFTYNTTGPVELIYLNGSQDGSKSSGFVSTPCATLTGQQQTMAQEIGTQRWFFNGKLDEVMIITNSTMSAANILALWNAGNGPAAGSSVVPYTVKRPELPHFRDDGYLDRFVSLGYNTGLLAERVALPRFFGFWPTLNLVPRGNVR